MTSVFFISLATWAEGNEEVRPISLKYLPVIAGGGGFLRQRHHVDDRDAVATFIGMPRLHFGN